MCGIAGIIGLNQSVETSWLEAAGLAMEHRGPDHQGVFLEENREMGLVHQRLSILDLDPRSHQPFFSSDGQYVMVFNGEIYNFKELRHQLESSGSSFKTNSDTEVLLEMFVQKGEDCLQELNGMFAFAVWNRKSRSLFIARDRLGIKPLYYSQSSNHFAFTSDLKTFQHFPGISRKLSSESIWQYLFFGYVPQPATIFKDVYKLLPGHSLTLNPGKPAEIKRYWSLPEANPQGLEGNADELGALLQKSVDRRRVSDVRLGAFASGGLDSSSILATIRDPEMPTYTIGFAYQSNPLDVIRSKEVSEALGMQHHLNTLDETSLAAFNDFTGIMDEPLSEASILPLLHNFRFAREDHTKVILSGDGADEIMGGYSYFHQIQQFKHYSGAPKSLWNLGLGLTNLFLGRLAANSKPGKFRDLYIRKTLEMLAVKDQGLCHQLLVSQNNLADIKKLSGQKVNSVTDQWMEELSAQHGGNWDQVLAVETQTALVNKHLAKVDKSSMANSVEARVPFLDHELVEYLFRLSPGNKTDKKLLKEAMQGKLPPSIMSDRKRGFNLPLKSWIKEYITAPDSGYLMKEQLDKLGLFSGPEMDQLIATHRKGKKDHSRTIWSLYALSQWLSRHRWES